MRSKILEENIIYQTLAYYKPILLVTNTVLPIQSVTTPSLNLFTTAVRKKSKNKG